AMDRCTASAAVPPRRTSAYAGKPGRTDRFAVTKAARNPPRHGQERSLSLAVRIVSGILTGPRARKRRPPRHFPRIGRLYPQGESCRKSPDRERRAQVASDRALFGTATRLTMSSILIRPSATETVRSVSASTGRMISLTRATPYGSASVSAAVMAARDIVSGNTYTLPAQLVTTVWSADTFEDAVSNQTLRDRLEMSRWKPVPGGECPRRNRASPRIDGNVNSGS